MKSALFFCAAVIAVAQSTAIKQGEQVFSKTCATGYCHGAGGTASGAPRVAARGFDQVYIQRVVSGGIADTAMPGFASRLSAADLRAVVAYVSSLNGATAAAGPAQALTGEAAKGALLFRDATKGFGRCSTCHALGGFGVPVAGPLGKIPSTIAEIKNLVTPNVKTATVGKESMPALVLSDVMNM